MKYYYLIDNVDLNNLEFYYENIKERKNFVNNIISRLDNILGFLIHISKFTFRIIKKKINVYILTIDEYIKQEYNIKFVKVGWAKINNNVYIAYALPDKKDEFIKKIKKMEVML